MRAPAYLIFNHTPEHPVTLVAARKEYEIILIEGTGRRASNFGMIAGIKYSATAGTQRRLVFAEVPHIKLEADGLYPQPRDTEALGQTRSVNSRQLRERFERTEKEAQAMDRPVEEVLLRLIHERIRQYLKYTELPHSFIRRETDLVAWKQSDRSRCNKAIRFITPL